MMTATASQLISVKAKVDAILARNRQRNFRATIGSSTRNKQGVLSSQKLRLDDSLRHRIENAADSVSREGWIVTIDDMEAALSDQDLDDAMLMSPEGLTSLAHAVKATRMREWGEIPPGWTAVTRCRHCGEVPVWKGCASQVEGCPWCFNRIAGRPMPI